MRKKYSVIISVCILLIAAKSFSQPADSTSKLSFSGYLDIYYAGYTDNFYAENFQQFPSVAPRNNIFGLNTAMFTAQYDAAKVRGTIALHYGDIAESAWSSLFNNVMEANAGVNICKNLWLDAGLFRTHFGTEGLLPKENIASSVSINTFYEPYYESGFRLNYIPTDKLALNLYVLNGYNMFNDINKKKSIGMLVTYTLGDKGNIGYSNYIGDDTPEPALISHLRIHQNLFVNYEFNKLKLQAGGDFGIQQNADITDGKGSASMYSGIASLKYQFYPKFAAYGRGELFNDPDGFMSTIFIDEKGKPTGYKLVGFTAGIEYKPSDNSYIRAEGRILQMDSNQEIFYYNKKYSSSRLEGIINMGISF